MQQFVPMSGLMIEASLSTFAKVAGIVTGLAVLIFTARVSLLVAFVGSPAQYAAVLKELIVFFAALALFSPLFKIVVSSTAQISERIAVQETQRSEGAIDKIIDVVKEVNPAFYMLGDLLPMSVNYLAQAVYSILIATICAVAPVVLLYQLVTGSLGGITFLTATLMTLSSWPIVWNSIGSLAAQLWPSFSQTSLSGVCFWIVVKGLQILSPLFTGMLIKNYTVHGAGKSMKAVTVIKKMTTKKALNT